MNKNKIIKQTVDFIRKRHEKLEGAHDWWHIYRVWQMARRIAAKEKADSFVVELGALLHDIADWKFSGSLKAGSKAARQWLESIKTDPETIDKVCKIIDNVSFKGAGVKDKMDTIEGKIVQDADRLDAIGAIGIARTFSYTGHIGQMIHDPSRRVRKHRSFKSYSSVNTTPINHFYEKLLLLKDRMHTRTAKKIAKGRHKVMLDFLSKFYKEWDGKD